MVSPAQLDRRAVWDEYERARRTFRRLLEATSAGDLKRPQHFDFHRHQLTLSHRTSQATP